MTHTTSTESKSTDRWKYIMTTTEIEDYGQYRPLGYRYNIMSTHNHKEIEWFDFLEDRNLEQEINAMCDACPFPVDGCDFVPFDAMVTKTEVAVR